MDVDINEIEDDDVVFTDVNEAAKEGQLARLRRLLKRGVVNFSYVKKDGTERKARGTLKDSLIPKSDVNDDRKKRKLNDDCFYYYDLKKDDWRCFRKSNFIKIRYIDTVKDTVKDKIKKVTNKK